MRLYRLRWSEEFILYGGTVTWAWVDPATTGGLFNECRKDQQSSSYSLAVGTPSRYLNAEDFRLADNHRQPRSAAAPREAGVAKQSSTDGSIHVMHAPPTSPTLVHQSL